MQVVHQPEQKRFVAPSSEGDGLLEYDRVGDVATITHTFVPPTRRGQGVAEALTRAALAWMHESGLRPAASCSYAQRYLAKHPST